MFSSPSFGTTATTSPFENPFFPLQLRLQDNTLGCSGDNMGDETLSSTSTTSSTVSQSNTTHQIISPGTTTTSVLNDKNNNTSSNNSNYHQLMKDLSSKDWTEKYRTTHVDIDLKHANLFSSSASESSASTTAALPALVAAPVSAAPTPTTATPSTTSQNTGAPPSSVSSLFSFASSVSNGDPKKDATMTDIRTEGSIANNNNNNNNKEEVDYEAEYYASLGLSSNGATSQPTASTDDSGANTDNHKLLSMMYPPFTRSRTSSLGSGRFSLSRSSSLSKSSNNNNNNNNNSTSSFQMANSFDNFKMSVDINVFMTPSMDAQMKIIHEQGKAIAAEESVLSASKIPLPKDPLSSNPELDDDTDTVMKDENKSTEITTPPMTKTTTSTSTESAAATATIPITTRSSSRSSRNVASTTTPESPSPSPSHLDASEEVKSMDTVSAIMNLADKIKADNMEVVPDNLVDHNKENKNKRKRTRRTQEPEHKEYVEPQPPDVLLGRGGRSNHHKGNVEYRNKVGELRDWYRSSEKHSKTDLSQMLVDWVHNKQKGRFLKMETTTTTTTAHDQWYVVSNIVARRKASQALREHMFPEERKARKKERGKSKRDKVD